MPFQIALEMVLKLYQLLNTFFFFLHFLCAQVCLLSLEKSMLESF